MKNGLPSVRSTDEPLQRTQFHTFIEQRGKHLDRAFLAQRVEPQLRVIGLVTPLMAVLGPIVHQQQDARRADAVGQQVQECLRLAIDPVQVFEDHYQRLVDTLAQQDALDRLQRASLAGLRLDLRDLLVLIGQAKQPIQVGKRVLQRSIEREHAPGYFLSPRPLVIVGRDLEIAPQQIDQGQEWGSLAVRDRERFQHHPARLRDRFELEQQTRLTDPRLRHRRDDLPVTGFRPAPPRA